MSIEIKEIVVKATIDSSSSGASQGANIQELEAIIAQLKEEIVNDCISAVFSQQSKNNER